VPLHLRWALVFEEPPHPQRPSVAGGGKLFLLRGTPRSWLGAGEAISGACVARAATGCCIPTVLQSGCGHVPHMHLGNSVLLCSCEQSPMRLHHTGGSLYL
jgi:hypothetical protein